MKTSYHGCDSRPSVADGSMLFDDDAFFFCRECSFFQMGTQMVSPSKATALPVPRNARVLLHSVPVPITVRAHIRQQ